ncbi:hypothetical protein [Halalkalibacter okhensis]|uniref:STAS domain-containing protein n=1 Tax=Halalkalibacter okhensis TaxID=333138 RepID=A0A0B0IB30_9BACI|nr:hypothetical protein [Halalkalibacter okhensis]KHF38490.1 hypothetical protein LQ50_21055 [Halalkalibacter okhensis]
MGIVVDKRKYKMAINETSREVRVQVHGLIKAEDAAEYMKDLEETINKVSRQSYVLVVDATHQTTTPSKVVPQLDQALQYYMMLGFKDLIVVKPSSKIAQVQIRNSLERINFTGKFVDHI